MKRFFVPGFRAAALHAGIRSKEDSRTDLALVVCDTVATAAGVFTRNKVRAAPGILAQKRISRGKARALLVNAGIANSMTGDEGMKAAEITTAAAANCLDIPVGQVLPASTGVIGVQLPVKNMATAVAKLAWELSPNGFADFSEAILTTDTVPKVIQTSFKVGNRKATMLGIAKGSGMVAPNMATMLAFIFTDAAVDVAFMRKGLSAITENTFNRITIDGDTSTNDSVMLLASGVLGNKPITERSRNAKPFYSTLENVCAQLSEMIVRDGEGATRIAKIVVKGAANNADAIKVARTIAESPLVKTALCGADPNWGRIVAAAGRAGAKLDQNKLGITIGNVPCVKGGTPTKNFNEKKAKAAMKKKTVLIEVNLGIGKGETTVLTCDLTKEYVEINAHYRT